LYVTVNKGFIAPLRVRGRKKGNLKMKEEPTMLLKTKENKNDILDDPTIFMKIKDLFF